MNEADLAKLPDDELILIAQRGARDARARAAASELLGRQGGRVFAWCRRYVHDRERAMDLAQDVLMTAYRALGTFRGRSRFSSWLFAIARNHCLNVVAADRRRPVEDADLEALPSELGLPEQKLQGEQERERLRALLSNHLEPLEARALWLLAVERMTVRDITTTLRLDNATGARGVLQTARRKLRAAISREHIRSADDA